MHRLRPLLSLRALLGVAVLVCLALPAVATAAPPASAADASAPNACEIVERELASTRQKLAEEHAATLAAERNTSECNEDLSTANERVNQSSAAATAARRERDHICSSTAALADEISRGQSKSAADTGCIAPEQQQRLDQTVQGWSAAQTWLAQAAAYSNGETDVRPPLRNGATPLDRLLTRAQRAGVAFSQRRLLVEALRRIAPNAFAQLRAGGASAVESWFVSNEPLDPAILEEAHHATRGAPGAANPSLTAALRLVEAFELTACGADAVPPKECARAHSLRQVLETSGVLVLRRRIEQIWATDCGELGGGIQPWLDDFPSSGTSGPAWADVAKAASSKLFSCYLDDPSARMPYEAWLKATLPAPSSLTSTKLRRRDEIEAQIPKAGLEVTCASAVRAMQIMPEPKVCAASPVLRAALDPWAAVAVTASSAPDTSDALRFCSRYARLWWEGKLPRIPGTFPSPPAIDELIAPLDKDAAPTPMTHLRDHCDQRRGGESFPADLRVLATIAQGFGEPVEASPFRFDAPAGAPIERVRYDASQDFASWRARVYGGARACGMLGLADERCKRCAELPEGAAYDCALAQRLESTWSTRNRNLTLALFLVVATYLGVRWLRRLRDARGAFGPWTKETVGHLEAIGLNVQQERFRNLLPSRQDTLVIALPDEPAWERWGNRAVVVRARPQAARVLERDINHAAFVARRLGANVALLEHDDASSLDMSAIRAMLEWSAKGGARAIQILPIGVTRAKWSKSAHDLLDLVEESSLRGDPFEQRGRITTSAQFFNRERLVSGLLASAQAGHWTVVTGLRRFGKSSLTLEVARRLPGVSAYVDLSGFDHEIGVGGDPLPAVDAILRFVCSRLSESARARWPSCEPPALPPRAEPIDAAALTVWLRQLSKACAEASSGRSPPLLVVLDEIEQVLAVGPDKLSHALDVLAIIVGRLKSAVGDLSASGRGAPVAVILASALHPLLWAPLRTLANQSIMGTFPRVCVPALSEEAATSMMRSLGARQGIRWSDAALSRIVTETQGVPLLLRRIGSAILELYDRERAREGSLGAMEIGVEGATEAIERESREGSPMRGWIDSEIAQHRTAAGAILRRLAREDVVSVTELRAIAKKIVAEDFVRTGIDRTLAPDEAARRAEEAASVFIQILDETGLLVASGDLTSPDGYSLPQGAIRRVLADQPSVSAFPVVDPSA
ncbi:MAG: hypothetical protein JWP97_1499 [Labilithrix sp.]|nr:hypothetical protein [Labilithrix sp.]